MSGSCITRWGGMTCSNTENCPSYAACCSGADPGCYGTRLQAGDGSGSGQYVVRSDGVTVTDTIAGLLWQRSGSGTRAGCAKSTSCTWAEAKAYCAGLVLGALSGWRLPTPMELLTLVDFTRVNPAIDATTFPSTPADSFWTSLPSARSADSAWYVSFTDGFLWDGDVAAVMRVRCVR